MITCELEYKTYSKLGEGAFWNYKTQELYWIDIENKKLHIYKPKTKINRSLETSSRIGTVVPIDNESAIIALENGIYIIDTNSGKTILFSEIENTITTNRFNDGKYDPLGNLWVSSMSLKNKKHQAYLYKVNKNGKAHKMLYNITTSNGIVWTKNKTTMYYIDTPTNKMIAYSYNIENATISNKRIAVEIPKKLGFPDGMQLMKITHFG